tara:strand:- start:802 stop:1302 length:501 start_codon:yes stop_codon:yes gene_type:complete
MDTINIDSITLEKAQKGSHYNILYEGNPISLETDNFPLPFGLEESYGNMFIKLCLSNIKNSKESQELYNFINSLENKLQELIPDCDSIQSQIRTHSKYDPILTVKIPTFKNTVSCDIVEKDNTPFNIYGLSKGDYVRCHLIIDTVWYFKGKYSYKIKAKKVVVDRK